MFHVSETKVKQQVLDLKRINIASIFSAKLDLQGNILHAISHGGTSDDYFTSLQVDNSGQASLLDATNKVLFFSP